MKRLVIVFLFLLLGVEMISPAQSTSAQGGLNLNNYCSEKGWGHATLLGDTVNNWFCDVNTLYRQMNLNEACVMQYGSGYSANYRDFNDPYSWYCQAPSSGGSTSNNTSSSNNTVNPPPSSSSPPTMDIAGWCRSMGHSGARFTGDAYSWICTNHDDSRARDIDVDAVCRFTNGDGYSNANFTDINNPYSWYCASTTQTRPGGTDSGNTSTGNTATGSSSNTATSGSSNTTTGGSSSTTTTLPLYRGTTNQLSGHFVHAGYNDIRVRTGPNTTYRIQGFLVEGHNYQVLQSNSGWVQIQSSQGTGWVGLSVVDEFGANYDSEDSSSSPWDQSDLDEPCVAVSSATLATNDSIRRCAESAFSGLPDEEMLIAATDAAIGCGLTGIEPTLQFVITAIRTWNPQIAAVEALNTPGLSQGAAECFVDWYLAVFE